MRLLFLTYSNTDTCSLYRAAGIAPDLRKQWPGLSIEIKQWDRMQISWANLINYDIVMMQRPYDQPALSMCRYLKMLGIPIWIDWDDLLLDPPKENKQYYTIAQERDTIIQLARIADVVSVPTRKLRDELSLYSENIKVIPNALNDTFLKRPQPKNRARVVLWRGSPEHLRDIMTYGEPLNASITGHPEWKFMFAGLVPWMFPESPNLYYAPLTDPFLYFSENAKEAPYLLHVPLQDTLFNRCKSNNAWMEATYFGAVCLAPAWDEWAVPGIAAYNSIQDYFDWMENIIGGGVNVELQVQVAWEYITDTLLLSDVNKLRIVLIEELL